ncbi:MAG TPA: hypothetical protein VK162_16670, partial [Streptosporangiaceae bacterium]|nr:hypothetical protein [Streptosporangiaceae bacterium]
MHSADRGHVYAGNGQPGTPRGALAAQPGGAPADRAAGPAASSGQALAHEPGQLRDRASSGTGPAQGPGQLRDRASSGTG